MTEQADWAKARANEHRFLSAAFLEPPGKAFIEALSGDGFIEEIEALFGQAAVNDLRKFAEEYAGDHESLDQEFQDLFMVPLERYVTPYESVYRDQRQVGDTVVRGLLAGSSVLAIKKLYRDAGADVSEDFKDFPDHIGMELACMEFLCEQEARAWAQEDVEKARQMQAFQKRLLDEHLLQWVPALCARIRKNAPGPFYRGVAGLTEASLMWEAGFLGG
jgi:TorA maturation chaperone TorD